MMRKLFAGLYVVLVLVLMSNIYTLWARMQHAPQDIRMADETAMQPLVAVNQRAPLDSYPRLFDVQAPISREADAPATPQAEGVDELIDTWGRLRVKAIFTSAQQRLALIESLAAEGQTTLIEVRENDLVQGYRVSSVASRAVCLENEKGGQPVCLIPFQRERAQPPSP